MIRRYGYDYVSTEDAARRYHYTEEHIQTLARLGKVGSLKIQGVVFVRLIDMHDYARRQLDSRIKSQRALRGSVD
jgi:hypothetical protein